MSKVICLLFTILFAALNVSAQNTWDLNDVSYLMPLPEKIGSDSLLKINSKAKGGDLLPLKLIQQLPPLTITMGREEEQRTLRVLAVRIDPCFPLPTPQSCQRQVRLVWQPLDIGPRQQVNAVDAAFHSFYVLNDDEFAEVLKDLSAWKQKYQVQTQRLPLQIHPAWAQEGDKSPALKEFNTLLSKHIGAQNLTRVTMMVLRGGGDMWAFAGFEPNNDKMQMLPVPRLGGKLSQSFINVAVPADKFVGQGIAPVPTTNEDTLNTISAESSRLPDEEDDLIRKEVRAAYRIENPKVFNPENMDCASCHVAHPAREWVLKNRPDLQLDKLWSAGIYQTVKYDLTNKSTQQLNTQQLRGLGYFGKDPSISQRVIHESAEVEDLVNKYFSAKTH